MICLHGVKEEGAAKDTAEKPFEDYRREHDNVPSDSSDSEDTDSTFSGLSSSTDTSSNEGDFISL